VATLIAVVAGVLVLIGGFALAARHGNKTWTDDQYEEQRSGGTALGNAFLATQAILDPGAQHALEQRTVEHTDAIDAEGGDPDDG
jgi:hypothetical protein